MNHKGYVIFGAMAYKLSKQQRCIQKQMRTALRDQCKLIVPMKYLMLEFGNVMKANGCLSKRKIFYTQAKGKAKKGNCLKRFIIDDLD